MLSSLLLSLIAYDPMALSVGNPRVIDETWTDSARRRNLPVKIYRPATEGARPVVLFSHGLGGSREANAFLAKHLARRGYWVAVLQHPGSDESVWRGLPAREIMPAMRKAASGENLKLRAEDVRFALNQIEKRPDTKGQPVGMSGHSFGAITTQVTSGMTVPIIRGGWNDSRIRAAIAYSPSMSPGQSVSGVKIPWMLMTGTKDDSPIGNTSPADRLKVFPALPKGDKYELVLNGAHHGAFSDATRLDTGNRNPRHHQAILALTTAFWDAYLKKDTAAQEWLKGNGPRSVLEPKDRWQTK